MQPWRLASTTCWTPSKISAWVESLSWTWSNRKVRLSGPKFLTPTVFCDRIRYRLVGKQIEDGTWMTSICKILIYLPACPPSYLSLLERYHKIGWGLLLGLLLDTLPRRLEDESGIWPAIWEYTRPLMMHVKVSRYAYLLEYTSITAAFASPMTETIASNPCTYTSPCMTLLPWHGCSPLWIRFLESFLWCQASALLLPQAGPEQPIMMKPFRLIRQARQSMNLWCEHMWLASPYVTIDRNKRVRFVARKKTRTHLPTKKRLQ